MIVALSSTRVDCGWQVSINKPWGKPSFDASGNLKKGFSEVGL